MSSNMPNTDTEKKVSTHSVTIEDKNYTVAEVSQIIIDTLSHVSDQSRFNNLQYSAADVYWVLNGLLGYINNRVEGEFKLQNLKKGTWQIQYTNQKKAERLSNQEQEKKKKVGSVNVTQAELSGPRVYARVSRRTFGRTNRPDRVLAVVPEGQRLGLLTHPSWLVSHSDAMDNHAILRGRWIRERLLGGGIPDVPITVDAMLPDEPKNTLRERMRVTRETYCWTCHEKMDPLGLPFEMYNHAGLFRTTELEKPVDTTGEIINSGVPELDGPVKNAIEMIDRLAKSEHVEQVFVRHAFRFWMGRNETLNDSPVLQAAHKAYRDNNGSMKALLTSLLTSDAFLFRNVERSKK